MKGIRMKQIFRIRSRVGESTTGGVLLRMSAVVIRSSVVGSPAVIGRSRDRSTRRDINSAP